MPETCTLTNCTCREDTDRLLAEVPWLVDELTRLGGFDTRRRLESVLWGIVDDLVARFGWERPTHRPDRWLLLRISQLDDGSTSTANGRAARWAAHQIRWHVIGRIAGTHKWWLLGQGRETHKSAAVVERWLKNRIDELNEPETERPNSMTASEKYHSVTERYRALAEDARYNRSRIWSNPERDVFEDQDVPTIDELEDLAAHVERCNTSGTTDAFVDAQAELIDALLVALEAAKS